ncbi:S-adenosylmethionine:tRNA ribosyltransferase-isomerase [Pinibacter aurantiacus]|uniref:S-adenosylmethionine:tRNA ribosyltransferase-isomerase n=1 Tax=Pinibacter aurantiacus TaxID=2851599 RepID=A0A9E2SE88_9BACT|nr:S-adenosylmethionine:tRNA ribosyltransferase-isomerase [Pinibacter aurantiacus]MBV4359872.1 S-adenosylmethionine:tRNA ribosyltransferase-isomerase [Pinibacter aurantiacus]
MNPEKLSINDYTYTLPEERIARFPLQERDASKLLVYKSGKIEQSTYSNISSFVPENSLLVFNNTKVVEARILFQKPTGGVIEIFCLEPSDIYPDLTTAMLQKNKVQWKCLIGGASKWKHGQILEKTLPQIPANNGDKAMPCLYARMIDRLPDCFMLELSWEPASLSFAEVLHTFGIIPIPPYLKRETTTEDSSTYQTIYAEHDGSVAAPTAGLHFTPAIFDALKQKSIEHTFVTLHVGAGTFKPVKAELMQDHEMHAEFIDVDKATIQKIIDFAPGIFAVGTTSLRTLESLYWMGVKALMHPSANMHELEIHQWDVYGEALQQMNVTLIDSMNALLQWMQKNNLEKILCKTQILIAPGYTFKVIKGLVTNFHQPQSTLLLLVAALIGKDWRQVYDYALKNDFRFLSYGDGSLLLNSQL